MSNTRSAEGMQKQYTINLKKLVDIRADLQKSRRWVTIMFSDLEGSTLYKLLKGVPVDSEVKIYQHNETVTQAVNRFGGKVVKYLGDGLMAVFEGHNAQINAIRAAVEVQKVFRKYNQTPKLLEIDRILSKTGIASGDASFWELERQKEPDPQGTIVDIAARLCDLAKPLQILCPVDVKSKCVGKIRVDFSPPTSRELKGIINPVSICEVLWNKTELGIHHVMHFSRPDPKIDSMLKKSARSARQRRGYKSHFRLRKCSANRQQTFPCKPDVS